MLVRPREADRTQNKRGVRTPDSPLLFCKVNKMIDLQESTTIRTDRLAPRRPEAADAARIAGLASDIEVTRMTASMPHPYGQADAATFLACVARADPAREAEFAIEHPREGLIGMLGFRPNEHGRTELGYWLGRPYWGRGYATEAVKASLRWAKTSWGRRWLVSGHFADNPASAAVLIKSGFLYTGDVGQHFSRARGCAAPSRMMVWLA